MPASTLETQAARMAALAAATLLVRALRDRRERGLAQFAGLTGSVAAAALGFGLPVTPIGGSLLAAGLIGVAVCAPFVAAEHAQLPPPDARLRRAQRMLPIAFGIAWITLPRAHEILTWAAMALALASTAVGSRWIARDGLAAQVPDTPEHTRLLYLARAHTAIPCGAALDALASQFGQPRLCALAATLLYLYVGRQHRARVRVKDLRQMTGTAVGLAFMASGLTGAFAALWFWGGEQLDAFVFNAFVASFALLSFLGPLRTRIQRAMDHRFVAGKAELERSFLPLCERLEHTLALEDFVQDVLGTSEATGRLRACAVFLREDPQLGFQLCGSFGLPQQRRIHWIESPELERALQTGTALLREELQGSADEPVDAHAGERAAALLQVLDDLGAQLLVPLRTEAQLLGFWALSDVSEREPFASREIELLGRVARRMARTVENTKSFARMRARDRLAMVGEMSAGLAHEIRNPLATIRGAVALLETSQEQADAAEIRRVIAEEIARLDRLVETFLDYARPAPGQTRVPDVGALVRACAEQEQRARAREGIALVLTIEPELPPLHTNPDHLERVVQNLLANAYDALQPRSESRIEVSVRHIGRAPHARIEIAIADDGPGMDAATAERAFIPFFTTKETGTGLGLPLCERLVRAQGGELHLHSAPGKGTQVRIWLPVVPHRPQAERARKESA